MAFSPQLLLKPYESCGLKVNPWPKYLIKIPSFQVNRNSFSHSPKIKIVKGTSSFSLEQKVARILNMYIVSYITIFI